MALQSILKCGKLAKVVLANSYNSTVTDSGGNPVKDLSDNTSYVLIQVTGSNPVASGLYLPHVEGNYVAVSNQCGTSIDVKSNPSDASPVSVLNGETAYLIYSGSAYLKISSTTATLDIGSFSADTSLADGDIFLLKSAADSTHHQVSLSTLKAYLGIAATSTSKLLAPATYLYTNNVASLSGPKSNQSGDTPTDGSRVLLVNQATATTNGLWVTNNAGGWSRPTDFTGNAAGVIVPILRIGSGRGGSVWECVNVPGSDGVGSANLAFHVYACDFTESIDISVDSVNSRVPSVVGISGGPGYSAVPISAKTLEFSNPVAFQNVIASANTRQTVIQEQALTHAGIAIVWEHYLNEYGSAVKKTMFSMTKDYSPATSGGGSVTFEISETDAFWNLHQGTIDIKVHCATTGRSFSRRIPFVTIHGKRMHHSDGTGSANSASSSDPATSWFGSDGSASGTWPTTAGTAATEPTLTIGSNMVLGAVCPYYVGITFGQYSTGLGVHVENIEVTIMLTAQHSSATQA